MPPTTRPMLMARMLAAMQEVVQTLEATAGGAARILEEGSTAGEASTPPRSDPLIEVRIETHSPEKYMLIDTDTRQIWGVVPDHESLVQADAAGVLHLRGRWKLLGRS